MRSKPYCKAGPLVVLMVLVASGCGSSQNPDRVATGPTPPLFNGMWDGFTALWVFVVRDLLGGGGFQLYNHHAGDVYWLGFLLGAVLSILAAKALARLLVAFLRFAL